MKNKTKGLIAGAAGIALLAGGSTFALWDASASANGGTITNGDLNVQSVGTPAWYDISADRTDATMTTPTPITNVAAHSISDIATWRMVPGDKVETTRALAVTLEGDNLVATLGIDAPGLTAGGAAKVGVTYQVYGLVGATKTLLTPSPVSIGTDTPLSLAAPRTGQAAGAPVNTGRTVLDAVTAPTANVWVVITADFPKDSVTGRVDTKVTNSFANIAVTLQQVRAGVDFK